jgi:hypothetical protein
MIACTIKQLESNSSDNHQTSEQPIFTFSNSGNSNNMRYANKGQEKFLIHLDIYFKLRNTDYEIQ